MSEEKVIGAFAYSESDRIGKGSFGQVFKAKHIETGKVVAVKVIAISSDEKKRAVMVKMIKNEVHAIKKCRCDHVVKFLDYQTKDGKVYIVTEFCDSKDLRNHLNKIKRMEEKKAIEMLQQIVQGYKEFVKKQILHRDLKPANVLLHKGQVKIADFGFAKVLDFPLMDYNSKMNSVVGTPLYMSPQLLDKEPYSAKSDIWSIGIIFYEMLFGRVPWQGKDPSTYLKNIKTQPLLIDRSLNDISPEAEDLLIRCLAIKESDRIGYQELFDHPLITGELSSTDLEGSEDSASVSDEDNTPEQRMFMYQTKPANPSNLMKPYQDKILEASKNLWTSNSQMELPKVTIDQKLRSINQIIVCSTDSFWKGNKSGNNISQSRTLGISLNGADLNEGIWKSTNAATQMNASRNKTLNTLDISKSGANANNSSEILKKKTSMRTAEDFEREISRIDQPLNFMKQKILMLDDLYNTIDGQTTSKSVLIQKFNMMLTVAKLIKIYFESLSSQVLPKKVKAKSLILDDYYQSDTFKKLLVFCETNKKEYDEIVKRTCRKIFDFQDLKDNEKDCLLDFYQEIVIDNNEVNLMARITDQSKEIGKLLLKQTSSKQKSTSNSSKGAQYLSKMLSLFSNESIIEDVVDDKFESLLASVNKVKEKYGGSK